MARRGRHSRETPQASSRPSRAAGHSPDPAAEAPAFEPALLERIRRTSAGRGRQQRKVWDQVLARPREVAFMTVAELAEAAGVSPATVVRSTSRLGYESYRQLQEDLRQLVIETPRPSAVWWQLERSLTDRPPADHVLEAVARANVESIVNGLTPELIAAFDRAAALLAEARRIAILGVRSSRGAAHYAYAMLRQFMPNVALADPLGAESVYAELVDLGSRDAFLGISLGGPHYATRTSRALELTAQRGVPTILLTSGASHPVASSARVLLQVAQTAGHYSLTPAMCLLDALVVELGKRKGEAAVRRLRELGELLEESDVVD